MTQTVTLNKERPAQWTEFLLTADSAGQHYELPFEIPKNITHVDWDEIAKLIRTATVLLCKLPVDASILPPIKGKE